jgi:hypothetical protein
MAHAPSIVRESHAFLTDFVHPLLQPHFPAELKVMAAGFFGYGSEVLGPDDQYSADVAHDGLIHS